MNRYLNLFDKNKSPISEEDTLHLDVVELMKEATLANSNLGKECTKTNTTEIIVQLHNCFPLLLVKYTMTFLPSNRIETLTDAFFLEYLVTMATNQTNKEAINIDLSVPIGTGIETPIGNTISTGSTLFIPKEQINYEAYKESFWTPELKDKVHVLKVEVSNRNFNLGVKYFFLDINHQPLSRKDVSKISKEDWTQYNEEDKKIMMEDFYETSMPFQNNANYLLKSLIKNYQG